MCLECGCGEHTALTCPECGGRVILINERTKCLSCGASPPLEAASPAHDERHHHHHHHHDAPSHVHDEGEADGPAAQEVVAKLRVLLPHWIEHNAEHAESFRTWADRARDTGDSHMAAHIEAAAQKVASASSDLEGLLEHLGGTAEDHTGLDHDHAR